MFNDPYSCKIPEKCFCPYCINKAYYKDNKNEVEKNNEYFNDLCGAVRLTNYTMVGCEDLEDFRHNYYINRYYPDGAIVVFYGNVEKIEKALSLRGVDVNNKDVDKKTPLMFASQIGHIKAVILLLSINASVNDKDNNGNNALFYASKNDHFDIVEVLKHWSLLMGIIVLKELIVYHELDATTLIDIYEY